MKKYTSFRNKHSIARILAVIVCLAMFMTLVACSNNPESTKPADLGPDTNQESNANDNQESTANIDKGFGDDFSDSDDDITRQMKTLVRNNPNYWTKLQQDADGNWIYHIGEAEVHLRTNIWDYIEYSPRVERQEKYVSGGMTYKVDMGKIAAAYGWERVSGYSPFLNSPSVLL